MTTERQPVRLTRREMIRATVRFGLGAGGLALLAACGAETPTVAPTVAPAAAPGELPAAAGNAGEFSTAVPVTVDNPVATAIPEVEVPHLDLHGQEGIIGLTEEQKGELRNRIQSDPEAADIFQTGIKKEADRILGENLQPAPVEQILVTSDNPQSVIDAGKLALQDMQYAYKLAYAATVEPENTQYAEKTKQYLLAWAETNRSTGNPINETNYTQMWIAYDLVKDLPNLFSDDEKEKVVRWIDSVAQKQMTTDLTIGNTKKNNWAIHRAKLELFAGIITGKQETVDAALKYYQGLMAEFYYPDGTTFDMQERDALVYQTYGVLPASEFARIYMMNGGPDLYHLQNNQGGSIAQSVDYILPFVRGEATHLEFANTTVLGDEGRKKEKKNWDPANAVPLLESASYFNPILVQDLAKVKKSESKFPTFNSLINSISRTAV